MYGLFILFLTLFTILGAILNAKMKRSGFVVYIVANVGWIIIDIAYGLYEQIPLWIMYIIISLYGWFAWGEKNVKHCQIKEG